MEFNLINEIDRFFYHLYIFKHQAVILFVEWNFHRYNPTRTFSSTDAYSYEPFYQFRINSLIKLDKIFKETFALNQVDKKTP